LGRKFEYSASKRRREGKSGRKKQELSVSFEKFAKRSIDYARVSTGWCFNADWILFSPE
jgi:hypothetical protein